MILGKRIYLRAIELEDLHYIQRWRNDPEILPFFYSEEPISYPMEKRWYDHQLQRTDECNWIISTRDLDLTIGMVGYSQLDWRNRRAEYGRLLIYDKDYRGGGYGAEAELLFTKHMFEYMNLNKLHCEVLEENEKVWKLHLATGYRVTGRYHRHIWKEGRWHDVIYMEMLRDDYISAPTQARLKKYLGTGTDSNLLAQPIPMS